MGNSKRSCRGLKVCCGVTAILLISLLTVLIVLLLTLFKPKEPKITSEPPTLENFDLIFFPVIELNMTLGIVVTVDNRNYGSFKYKNSTAYVSYHGIVVAEAPIEDGKIPARGKHNISTSITVFADKLASNSNFLGDSFSGVLNFSSTTTLRGKVSMLKFFNIKASSYSSCDISIFIQKQSIDSVCKSKVRL
ncbi:Late embryogenesis abundant protein [Melia azedarach]|uniref:Late embryogenesis abundant protein n=1 Tax=Melia azedarach TaxID=155640 RepID=A0ACC1WVE4_MELAZ|nr:Late embryogenesis abundant protein [Melia azedarach]